MKTYKYPEKKNWEKLLARPAIKEKEIRKIVKPILKKVMEKGDKALRIFTSEYDHFELQDIMVSPDVINQAREHVRKDLKDAIKVAYRNIEKFHRAQITPDLEMETSKGVRCIRKSVPIQKVGIYVPGGSAPLFSTILMLAIPARIAGCEEIVMCTPADQNGNINPVILYTANLCGINKIARIGGAQAIAAMAFGTESVPKVNKIFGPGNQYVTAAKQIVSNHGIAIDMPAGPSELAIIADDSSVPEFVAADLLSQAEHGIDSQVILISTSEKLIEKVKKQITKQSVKLPRVHIVRKSLTGSKYFLVQTLEEAIQLSDAYAPEHLIIATENHHEIAFKIKNAGSVFIGNYTPESAGDYASGTNHTLPTYGYARSYSGVSMDTFVKKITYQKISKEGILDLGPAIEIMAEAEELMAHKNAVSLRLKKLKNG